MKIIAFLKKIQFLQKYTYLLERQELQIGWMGHGVEDFFFPF